MFDNKNNKMYPTNFKQLCVFQDNINVILFKVAIQLAENGLNIWIISPEAFDAVPETIIPPTKEVLSMITFLYLKDYNDLILHLNGIHMWHKVPNIILLTNFHKYAELYKEEFNAKIAALITISLQDSTSCCAVKKATNTGLVIFSDKPPVLYENRVKFLDFYFRQK